NVASFNDLIACWRTHLEADGFSGPAIHAENLGIEMHLDALIAQHLQNCGCDVGIFPGGKLWSRFNDAHPAAEASIGLSQFQADIAAAKYNQVVGQTIEL